MSYLMNTFYDFETSIRSRKAENNAVFVSQSSKKKVYIRICKILTTIMITIPGRIYVSKIVKFGREAS